MQLTAHCSGLEDLRHGAGNPAQKKKKPKTVEVIVPTAMLVVVKVTKEFEPIRLLRTFQC